MHTNFVHWEMWTQWHSLWLQPHSQQKLQLCSLWLALEQWCRVYGSQKGFEGSCSQPPHYLSLSLWWCSWWVDRSRQSTVHSTALCTWCPLQVSREEDRRPAHSWTVPALLRRGGMAFIQSRVCKYRIVGNFHGVPKFHYFRYPVWITKFNKPRKIQPCVLWED